MRPGTRLSGLARRRSTGSGSRAAGARRPATGSPSTRSGSASCGPTGGVPARAARRGTGDQQRLGRPARRGRPRSGSCSWATSRRRSTRCSLSRGLPRVDVLKVAHHGSRTSSTGPFLDAVRPRVAVASAGAGNPYGHPAPATLDRLAASRCARCCGRIGTGRSRSPSTVPPRLDVRPERRDRGRSRGRARTRHGAGVPASPDRARRSLFSRASPQLRAGDQRRG